MLSVCVVIALFWDAISDDDDEEAHRAQPLYSVPDQSDSRGQTPPTWPSIIKSTNGHSYQTGTWAWQVVDREMGR